MAKQQTAKKTSTTPKGGAAPSPFPCFAPYLNNEGGWDATTPFANCIFGRKNFAENLATALRQEEYTRKGFVIGLDAPWGFGKSTFMDMLGQHFMNEGFLTIPFNAWQNDFTKNPFLSFMATFAESLDANNFEKYLSTILNETSKALLEDVVQTFFPIVSEVITAAIKGHQKATEKPYETFLAEKQMHADFREKLATFAKKQLEFTGRPITILVDELDRCRPNYAIELLESIKHFFDVPGIIFLLAVNRQQLEAAFEHVYGLKSVPLAGATMVGSVGNSSTGGEGYFEKFIDRFFDLPAPSLYVQALTVFNNSGFCGVFGRAYGGTCLSGTYLPEVAEIFAFWAQRLATILENMTGQKGHLSPREMHKILNRALSLAWGTGDEDKKWRTEWHLYVALTLCFYEAKKHALCLPPRGESTNYAPLQQHYPMVADKEKTIKFWGVDVPVVPASAAGAALPKVEGDKEIQEIKKLQKFPIWTQVLFKTQNVYSQEEMRRLGVLEYIHTIGFFGYAPIKAENMGRFMAAEGPSLKHISFLRRPDAQIGQNFDCVTPCQNVKPFAHEIMAALNYSEEAAKTP